jgi:UDP:flavonoid glycosyltransferase YjiC (YdhE family)
LNILLIPLGSAGDVHPFTGVGVALRQRGHRVTVITNRHFEPLIRRVGLEFVEFGTEEQYLTQIEDPDLWHPLKGFQTVFQKGILPSLRPLYETVVRHYVSGETVVAASTLAFAARAAQDKLGIPLATVHLQPSAFRSEYQPPVYPRMSIPAWFPRAGKRLYYWLLDRLALDPIVAPGLNAFRAELGLPPVRRVLKDWWHSPQRLIGLFPDWFAPPQPDWPPQLRLTGFPLFDEKGVQPVPEEVETFLAEGDPPVVFTPGSAMRHGQPFFQAAVEACRLLGRRGLLLTRFREQLPADLPKNVRHFDFVPFSQVLPRCAALVYHGGIGTASQALAASVPHLVMPMAHDQPDNAARLERLGVARTLKPRSFRARKVAAALEFLLTSKEVAERCRTLAEKCRQGNPLDDTCVLIEQLSATTGKEHPCP